MYDCRTHAIVTACRSHACRNPKSSTNIKSLSDYKRNTELNDPCLDPIPDSMITSYSTVPQPIDLGEKVPEPLRANKDLLLEEIRCFKLNEQQGTLTESIRKALRNVEEEILNTEPGRGNLGKKRRRKMRGVNPGNILEEKRPRANSNWSKSMVVYEKEELPVVPSKKALIGLQPLERVKILTSRFGRVNAKG